ncbi:hypothetical protein RhiirC2_800561 [Rhizophagus irregularis]|uniref:Uncharacterized protein n=1 Tax=Rhizophagus irregularis TaxID=588596 RepID=A0A2N1M3G9_9GLOM|nr:hypothetical protein RhiirC2_800561 [Rhizophagus irregularis]
MDKFLDEAHKKSVGDKIRRCNKEKKLPRELAKNQLLLTNNSVDSNKSNKSRHLISNLPEDSEKKRKHIIGLVLERFPYLSLRDSGKRLVNLIVQRKVACQN